MTRRQFLRILATAGVFLLCTTSALTDEVRHLKLSEAVRLAIEQNRALKIARFKVQENEHRKEGARSDYFPVITNQSNALHISELQNLSIPPGAFGTATGAPIPNVNTTLPQGKKTFISSGTMIAQPLTQLLRIHQENRIAAAEVASSREDLKNAENEIALQVHALYYGILVELNDLLGLPLDTKLDLESEGDANFETLPKAEYVKEAWEENPEIRAAEEAVEKARAGVAAAKTAYIPDITAFARHSYQDGVPFLVHNFGTVGVNLNYTLWDFGKRRSAVREHASQLAEAEQNLERLKEEVAVAVTRDYNKLERTRSMVNVATQVAQLRQESERLATNQATQGVVLTSNVRQATAANYEAKAELLQARLGYLLAWAELERTIGRAPGLAAQ